MKNLLPKIQEFWTKEWILRGISLCLAVLLWYLVGGQDLVEKNVLVPVEVINLPKGLTISNKYKKQIDVSVKGPRSILSEMGQNQSPMQIDLSSALPGTHVETIANESIPVSRGVEVLRVQPSSIILSLDKLVEKELQINAITTGHLAEGFILKELRIDPKTIRITGPQTVLSQVSVLKTVPINIQGLSQSTQFQIPLQLDPVIVDLIGETSVTADLTIGYDSVEKVLKDIPVLLSIDGFIQEVEPAKVTVRVNIPKTVFKKEMAYEGLIQATASAIDNSDLYKVMIQQRRDLDVPLEIVSVEPQFVRNISKSNVVGSLDGKGENKTPKKDNSNSPGAVPNSIKSERE